MAGGQVAASSLRSRCGRCQTLLRSIFEETDRNTVPTCRLLISGYEYNIRILIFSPAEARHAALTTPPTIPVAAAIRKAQHSLRLATDDVLRNVNLTAPQYFALAALAAQPGLSGAALARRCFVTPQTMTGIVANLTAGGLISRQADPEHGRIIQTHLTAEGAALLAKAHVLVERVEAGMLHDIDPVEREALTDLLVQCADALAR